MKKILVILIGIIYFTVTCGIVINVNYCKGNYASTNLELLNKKPCKCSKKIQKSCCINQEKFVKLDQTHKASETKYNVDAPIALLQNHNYHFTRYNTYTKGVNYKYILPIIKGQKTYKLNCVFRV